MTTSVGSIAHKGFKVLRGDADNVTFGIVVGEGSHALHVLEGTDAGTDWNVAADTHPSVYLHSATTPATKYLKTYHDGTNAYVNVDGTSVLTMTSTTLGISTATSFSGTFTDDCIDFTSVVINHTGSAGPCMIRAGTYGNPATTTFVENADEDQSGMVRLYGATSANGSSYDRGVFACLVTTGTKGIFPISGLAEVRAQTGAGPAGVGACQFIAHMNSATAKVATRGTAGTASFYGAWLKVTSSVGSEASSGSVVAPVWLDNQMNGTVSGEEYAAYITSGTLVDAVFGFEGTGGGRWNHLFYFDSTCASLTPFVSTGCTIATGDTPYLKVLMDATEYGIPLITI